MWASPLRKKSIEARAVRRRAGEATAPAPSTSTCTLPLPCHSEPVLTLAWESSLRPQAGNTLPEVFPKRRSRGLPLGRFKERIFRGGKSKSLSP